MEEHKRIKAVIFDIDNTLYSYDENHIDGMKALEDYCKSAFQITREEMELYYKKAAARIIFPLAAAISLYL